MSSPQDFYGYGYDDNESNANAVFSSLAAGSLGFSQPFVSDFNISVPRADGPQGLFGLMYNMMMQNMMGTQKQPFRLANIFEPPAGDMGGYGLSRFPGNSARMRAAQNAVYTQRREAVVDILNGPWASKMLPESLRGFSASAIRADQTGIVDSASAVVARLTGAGADYGATALNAAKNAEALMTPAERAALARTRYGSAAWEGLIGESSTRFYDAAKGLMYKKSGNSFVRNEEFMRGFSDTDVGNVLERVVASMPAGEDIETRIKEVGGAAIGTLEAFKELFGSAEKAKQMLNYMTGGGMSNLDKESFDRLTNAARGVAELGYRSGLNQEAVSGMIRVATTGVQGAMGYSAADIAGGYANGQYTTKIATQFVAQELADRGVSSVDMLDPVEAARVNQRATWRAVQFAGSASNKFMTALQYGRKNGLINENVYNRARDLFMSGDEESMQRGARIVASALNLTNDEILDPTHFKIFADDVASSSADMDALADMGIASATSEDKGRTKKSVVNAQNEMASRAASTAGMSSELINDVSMSAKVGSIKADLRKFIEGGDRSAAYVLKNLAGLSDEEALEKFEAMRGMLSPGVGDYVSANADAASANALNDRAYGESRIGEGFDITEKAKEFGANLKNGNLTNLDVGKIVKGFSQAYRDEGRDDIADRIDELAESGQFARIFAGIERDRGYEDRAAAVLSNIGFTDNEPENVVGDSRTTLSDLIGNEKTTVEETFAGGTKAEATIAALGSIGKTRSDYISQVSNLEETEKQAQKEYDRLESELKALRDNGNPEDSDVVKAKKAELDAVNRKLGEVGKNKAAVEKKIGTLDAIVDKRGKQNFVDFVLGGGLEGFSEDVLSDIQKNGQSYGNANGGLVFSEDFAKDRTIVFDGKKVNLNGNSDLTKLVNRWKKSTGTEGTFDLNRVFGAEAGELTEDERKLKSYLQNNGKNVLIDIAQGPAEGQNKVAQDAGLADLANSGFDGAMVAVDKFGKAISDVGDRSTVTVDKLAELGAAITAIVTQANGRNVSGAQALTAWATATTEEERNAAAEALRGAFVNPSMSDQELAKLFDKFSESLKSIEEKFDLTEIKEILGGLADAIAEKLGAILN